MRRFFAMLFAGACVMICLSGCGTAESQKISDSFPTSTPVYEIASEKEAVSAVPAEAFESVSENPALSVDEEALSAVESPEMIDVSIEMMVMPTSEESLPVFLINTNLPDSTKMVLTLSNDSGYLAKESVEVKYGRVKSSVFSNNGETLENGDYILSVYVPSAPTQPPEVRSIIGDNGEFLSGDGVEQNGAYNIVNCDFNYSCFIEIPEPTPAPSVAPAPEPVEQMVWIPTNGGTKYHSKSSCSGMKDPQQVSISSAKAQGYDACKKCY